MQKNRSLTSPQPAERQSSDKPNDGPNVRPDVRPADRLNDRPDSRPDDACTAPDPASRPQAAPDRQSRVLFVRLSPVSDDGSVPANSVSDGSALANSPSAMPLPGAAGQADREADGQADREAGGQASDPWTAGLAILEHVVPIGRAVEQANALCHAPVPDFDPELSPDVWPYDARSMQAADKAILRCLGGVPMEADWLRAVLQKVLARMSLDGTSPEGRRLRLAAMQWVLAELCRAAGRGAEFVCSVPWDKWRPSMEDGEFPGIGSFGRRDGRTEGGHCPDCGQRKRPQRRGDRGGHSAPRGTAGQAEETGQSDAAGPSEEDGQPDQDETD